MHQGQPVGVCPMDQEHCPKDLGYCQLQTPDGNVPTCICLVESKQVRNHCGTFFTDVYKDLYLLTAINFIFYLFGTVFVAMTIIYRIKNDKWQFNISNNCHIILFIWGLAMWLRSTTIQGKAWSTPLYYSAFSIIKVYCVLAAFILITDFWIQLTGTFTRGARKHVSKIDTFKEHIFAIVTGILLIAYDIGSIAQLHMGMRVFTDEFKGTEKIQYFMWVSYIVALLSLSVTIFFGFTVVLYFRKNNISGNLPITKMTVLALVLVITAFIVNIVVFIVLFVGPWNVTTTFVKARMDWFLDGFTWIWYFVILVTLRGGNFFEMFKPSAWRSKSDDTSKLVGESTTVTVSTTQSGTSTGFSTSTATASSTVDSTTSD